MEKKGQPLLPNSFWMSLNDMFAEPLLLAFCWDGCSLHPVIYITYNGGAWFDQKSAKLKLCFAPYYFQNFLSIEIFLNLLDFYQ